MHLGCERSTAVTLLRDAIQVIDLDRLSTLSDDVVLLEVLAYSVGAARYWQDPDEVDVALNDQAVIATLSPVAEAIGNAPASQWWPSDIRLGNQIWVDWREEGAPPPNLWGALDVLHEWRRRTIETEARFRGKKIDGEWWSPPILQLLSSEIEGRPSPLPELRSTTRELAHLGAVGLILEEDAYGTPNACCWPVRPRSAPRVFEIRGPDDWIDLATHFPLEVTWGRRYSWQMASGHDGRWLLPDWLAVAEEYDAVHLTVSGYLATSGRALMLEEGVATFVAGWNPDESYWLNDIVELAGAPAQWEASDHHPPRAWHPVSDETVS